MESADRDVSEFRGEIREFRQATTASFNALRQDFVDLRRDFVDLRTHVDNGFTEMRGKFDRLDPWKDCGDCAFIPVCAGGCLVASHTQLGDMNVPTCHKRSFESALISLAHDVASAA